MPNELRAVEKVCRGMNPHVLEVYNYGPLIGTPFYFIDMELCDMNLEEYIYQDNSSTMPATDIWRIMKDITDGVAFVHGNNEVHRDLKPTNSDLTFRVS